MDHTLAPLWRACTHLHNTYANMKEQPKNIMSSGPIYWIDNGIKTKNLKPGLSAYL